MSFEVLIVSWGQINMYYLQAVKSCNVAFDLSERVWEYLGMKEVNFGSAFASWLIIKCVNCGVSYWLIWMEFIRCNY